MKYLTLRQLSLSCLGAVAAASLACGEPSPAPLSPSAAIVGEPGAGPDGSLLKVSAPSVIAPADWVELDDDTPTLTIGNASATFVDGLPLSYVFELFDEQGGLVHQSDPVASGDGQTSHELTRPLPSGQGFTWRAHATYDGQKGPASTAGAFRTGNRVDLFGPSCAYLKNALAIVQCRRAQFGFMNEHHRLEFLRRIAYDLNRSGHPLAPFGLLIKTTGNNCFGYSCDIVCSNTGGVHRQWDVLSDENRTQAALWGSIGHVAPRPCEFVR
jgi:hypothetical protein